MKNKEILRSLFFICVAVGAVYSNIFGNPFIWDDQLLIVNNPHIRHWHSVPVIFRSFLFTNPGETSSFYRPLQSLSFLLDYKIWGLDAAGYRLTNLLLHLGACLLFYSLIFKLSGKNTAALTGALLFAVHPIHGEAVTYISGRADTLAAVFILGSFVLYLDRRSVSYFLSLSCFAGALLSKEISLVFPLIILAGQIGFKNKNFSRKRLFPFLLVSFFYIYARLMILPVPGENLSLAFTKDYFFRLATFIKAFWVYILFIIRPAPGVQMGTTIPLVENPWSPLLWIQALGIALLFYAGVRSRQKSPPVFFFSLWFFIFLAPFTQIIKLNALLAEHWLYFPAMGFFALTGTLFAKIIRQNRLFSALFIPLFIFPAFLTFERNSIWKDEAVFYENVLKNNPDYALALYNLANVHKDRGNLKKAEGLYLDLLRKQPLNDQALVNLGVVYLKEGREDKSRALMERAIEINPRRSEAYGILGLLNAGAGNEEEAEENYRQAIALNPFVIDNYINLGSFYAVKGETKKAEEIWKEALSIDPKTEIVLLNLGILYYRSGETEKARKMWSEALRVNPLSRMAADYLRLVGK